MSSSEKAVAVLLRSERYRFPGVTLMKTYSRGSAEDPGTQSSLKAPVMLSSDFFCALSGS